MKNVRKASARKTGNDVLENLHPTGEVSVPESEREQAQALYMRGPCGWWSVPQVSSVLPTRAEMPGAWLLNAPHREPSVHQPDHQPVQWVMSQLSFTPPEAPMIPKEFLNPSS